MSNKVYMASWITSLFSVHMIYLETKELMYSITNI